MAHITHTEIVSLFDIYGYQTILKYFDKFPTDAQKHTDHFLSDREGFLEKNNITLRVREKENGIFQIDFKLPDSKEPGGMIDIKEIISRGEFENLKNGFPFSLAIQEALEKLNLNRKNIFYTGYVKTKRITIPCESVAGKWVIDHSIFPVRKDEYRIELKHGREFCVQATDIFEKILQRTDVPLLIPPSKFKILADSLREDEKVKETIAENIKKNFR